MLKEKVLRKTRQLWYDMMKRCSDNEYKSNNATYEKCYCSESFSNMVYFKEWCDKQIGFKALDDKGRSFTLDKDILIKGNKIYSEDTCCFVPQEVNKLFVKSGIRKKYPLGVNYHTLSGKYRSSISYLGKHKYLGLYLTPQEAFNVYKQAKEAYIKEVANKWKDNIDPRVYEALMNWEVDITD